jgi:hypothetical protein
MSNTYTNATIQKVNSGVSYPDLLGLYVGLTRNVGENNVQFLERLYKSSMALKNSSAQGLIDTISFNLGLDINKGISITGPSGYSLVLVPGVLILNSTKIVLFNLAQDTYMEWLTLSQVVASINGISGFTAELLVPDNSAITLCKQTNINLTLNENVETINLSYKVSNPGLVSDSLLFNYTPSSYTVSGDTITFTSPPVGLSISYQNIISPYTIVTTDVNLVSLNEPNLIAAATTGNNAIGFQLQSAIDRVMSIDRSYWTV